MLHANNEPDVVSTAPSRKRSCCNVIFKRVHCYYSSFEGNTESSGNDENDNGDENKEDDNMSLPDHQSPAQV